MNQHEVEAVFQFICQHVQEFSRPPTLREIAAACFMSTTRAMRCLDRLDAGGWIIRDPGVARGITLVRDCDAPVLKKLGK